MIKKNDIIPFFELLDTNNNVIDPSKFKNKVIVIIFFSNKSPYCKAYIDRIISFYNHYSVLGVVFLLINSNNEAVYQEESLTSMRLFKEKFNLPILYLKDKNGIIARKFGATITPEAFVFNKSHKLVYKGRIDDNWRNPEKVKDESLKLAISNALSGKLTEDKTALGNPIIF